MGDAPSTQPSLINLVSQIRALEIENELHVDNKLLLKIWSLTFSPQLVIIFPNMQTIISLGLGILM